jgi:hypothetical protein
MKKVIFALLIAMPAASFAQTLKDFFSNASTPAVYLGLDFSKTRIISDPGANPEDMKSRTFSAINDLTIKEVKKFDIADAFHRASVDHDFTGVEKNIGQIDAGTLASSNTSDATRLKEADIHAVVKGLDVNGKKGIGILFVVEGLDKADKNVTVWVTLINCDTKTVLLTERITAKTANGFGERNFWASGIHDVVTEVKEHKYKEWQKKTL